MYAIYFIPLAFQTGIAVKLPTFSVLSHMIMKFSLFSTLFPPQAEEEEELLHDVVFTAEEQCQGRGKPASIHRGARFYQRRESHGKKRSSAHSSHTLLV